MRKVILFTLSALILSACGDDNKGGGPDVVGNEIKLSAGVVTRATADQFPNAVDGAAQVAIAAKMSDAADWNVLYINHKPANVGDGAGDSFSLTWPADGKQYWPEGSSSLDFISYSPVRLTRNGATGLDITLHRDDNTKVPDILVANKTPGGAPVTASYDGNSTQTPASIDFRYEHILSQLVVRFKGINMDGEPAGEAKVTRVEVKVADQETSKTYDMVTGVWNELAGSGAVYTFSNSGNGWVISTDKTTVNDTRPLLLFAGTQDSVEITFYVKTGETPDETKLRTVILGDATSESPGSPQKAVLLPGYLTTLTVNLNAFHISSMTASVSDWMDAGEFTANI